MIFRAATCRHLGIARAIVFGVLLVDLLVDDLPSLSCMPVEAFLPHGVLRLIPSHWWPTLLTANALRLFSYAYGVVLACGLAGLGPASCTTSLALVGTAYFHGLGRGFGGHVNHQELIVLHAAFFLLFRPSFYSFSISRVPESRVISACRDPDATARFLLRCLAFWIFLTYFYIGVARLQSSDWRLYSTNLMVLHAVTHSVKWNYWGFSWARNILDQPLLSWLMAASFPLATVLELTAPFAVFFRWLVWPVVLALIAFHLAILVFMNIFFWQNLLLLSIPVMGWYVDRERRTPNIPDSAGQPWIAYSRRLASQELPSR
jgi:hypothetical protein